MRRLLAVSAAVAFLVACSSFSSEGGSNGLDGGDAAAATDGSATESGAGGDATSDGPAQDDGGATDGDTGAGERGCTAFDGDPATIVDWARDVNLGGSLTSTSRDGRAAIEASVMAGNARARLVHDFKPGPGGTVSVTVDLTVSTSMGFSSSLVQLVTVACGTPAQALQLEVDSAGNLAVEAVPGTSAALLLGAPPASWTTLTLAVSLTAVTVKFGASTYSLTMPTSFSGAAGCTVGVGALASGGIGPTRALYSRACIE